MAQQQSAGTGAIPRARGAARRQATRMAGKVARAAR
jgi:hypothetical protein